MNFGEVLTKAWQIIWKHKVLWIFGILAGCASSGNSSLNYTFSGSNATGGSLLPPAIEGFFATPERLIPWIILAVLLILGLVVLAIFLSTIGRIGLIRGAQSADSGSVRLTLGELFSGSVPYFWRVFLLNLMFGLAVAVIFVLIGLGMIFGGIITFGLALLCFIPICCLLIPVSWALNIFLEQANIAIVVEDTGIFDGLSRGWKVFTTNLGIMIGMGVILWLITLFAGLVIGLPFIFTLSPLMGAMLWQSQEFVTSSLIFSLVCTIIYLPILIFLYGILTSYVKSAWTLTFLRLTIPKTTIPSTDNNPPFGENPAATPQGM